MALDSNQKGTSCTRFSFMFPLGKSERETGKKKKKFIFTNPSNKRKQYLLDIQHCPKGL